MIRIRPRSFITYYKLFFFYTLGPTKTIAVPADSLAGERGYISLHDRLWLMFQKHKRESSPDSIGEPINEEDLIGLPMKLKRTSSTAGGGGGKSSNPFDHNGCERDIRPSSAAASPSSSAAPTTAMAGSSNGGGAAGVGDRGPAGGSTSVVSISGNNKPNSSTSSVVVNLPTSYPNSEMDYGSVSYPPSPSLSSSNNDKPQVRITFL